MDIYSKDIDEQVREEVEQTYKPLDPEKDHLDVDPVKDNQKYFLVSFAKADRQLIADIEALCFSYFLTERTNIDDLITTLQDARSELDAVKAEESDDNAQELLRYRITNKIFEDLVKRYVNYKKDYTVYLRNKCEEHFGDLSTQRIESAFKMRGTYKSITKAKTAAERMKKDGFTIFTGETGKWMPVNPNKFQVENYESTNKELNKLIKSRKDEAEKAKRSFGLRKELLKRQGAKIADDIKQKNLEDMKAAMLENQPNRRREEDGVIVSYVDNSEDTGAGTGVIEIDLLEDSKPTKRPTLEDVLNN